eukprot:12662025-Ditylum_brightwellii.AAC.2
MTFLYLIHCYCLLAALPIPSVSFISSVTAFSGTNQNRFISRSRHQTLPLFSSSLGNDVDLDQSSRRSLLIKGASFIGAAASVTLPSLGGDLAAAIGLPDDANGDNVISSSSIATSIQSELTGKDVYWKKDINGIIPHFSTSTLDTRNRQRVPEPQNSPHLYPSWMNGDWNVKYTFQNAVFPQGRRALSLRVPGAGIATCMALPNVGWTTKFAFQQRYLEVPKPMSELSCYPDVAFNVPRLLEVFWTEGHTTYISVGPSSSSLVKCFDTGDGCTIEENPSLHSPSTFYEIGFSGPTRRNNGERAEQRVECLTYRSESAIPPATSNGESKKGNDASIYYTAEDVIQFNAGAGLEGRYRVISAWEKQGNEEVIGTVRVAAFLPAVAVEEAEDGSGDKVKTDQAVALYDYRVTMSKSDE